MQGAPHQPLFAQAPLAQLATAFAIGILVAHYIRMPHAAIVFCGVLLSAMAFVALVKQCHRTSGILLIAAVFMTGTIVETQDQQLIPPNQLKYFLDKHQLGAKEVEITGVIDGAPDFAFQRAFVTLNVEQLRYDGKDITVSGTVALSIWLQTPQSIAAFNELDLQHGARIRARTNLRRTDNFRNPGVLLLTEYLDRKGYDATAVIKSPFLIERLIDAPVFLPLSLLYEWRRRVQQEINRRFSPATAGVLDASLLGNRHSLSPDVAERFRIGGTFHVLVISGLHISFIASFVFLLMRRLTKRRALQFFVSTGVLWGYTLAVGADASVARAALMFTVIAFGQLLFRHASSLNAAGATALVLLLWEPRNLFDPSFQLTCLSVLAIVVLAWPTIQKISAIGSWRPTSTTPHPPSCSRSVRAFAEILFWSERQWQLDSARSLHQCRLFKTPFASRLERFHVQPVLRYIFAAVVVSMSVQLVLLPFMVIYFHRVSVASLILNIVVGMLMAGLAIVAMAALLIAQLSETMAGPLIQLANIFNWLMVHSVDPFARVGLAALRLPHYSGPAGIVYWIYYAPLTSLAIALTRWNPLAIPQSAAKKHKRRNNSETGGNDLGVTNSRTTKRVFVPTCFARFVPLCGEMDLARTTPILVWAQLFLLVLIVLHPFSAGTLDSKLRIDFLDVGQGDSALVTMPDGATLLIDGGGQPRFTNVAKQDTSNETQFTQNGRSIGERVVSEYLWSVGLDAIDYVLVTHADADHIDGLNDVIRNFRVRAALAGRNPRADPEFQNFTATLVSQNVPLQLIGAGDLLRFGSVTAEVLWPNFNDDPSAPSRNNDSVTLRLVFGNRKVLMTGDIEARAEAAIVNSSQAVDADVVKVPHHGSRTSSTDAFVNATHPRFAVISVGQRSMFGHPNEDVVDRWRASGAQVLTTGNSGTITIRTDGSELLLTTFVGEQPGHR